MANDCMIQEVQGARYVKGRILVSMLNDVILTVIGYLKADWLVLLIGILMAVTVNVYVDPGRMKRLLVSKAGLSIPGAVAFGAFTPLCACGTMAVLISMFVSAMPWGAVMAFLISSPLTSPSEYVFEAAFLGTRFASAVVVTSIVLGLSSGFLAHFLETRTNFFRGQFRLADENDAGSSCCSTAAAEEQAACCASTSAGSSGSFTVIDEDDDERSANRESVIHRYHLDRFAQQFVEIGLKKIMLYFVVFIAIGRIVELSIPKSWIDILFSGDKAYSIPLSATIGLPLYVSNSAALPLLRTLANAGASEGAIMAFLITGKATGIPVIAGMSAFLKPRAMAFYVAAIYIGGMVAGYAYQFFVSLIQ